MCFQGPCCTRQAVSTKHNLPSKGHFSELALDFFLSSFGAGLLAPPRVFLFAAARPMATTGQCEGLQALALRARKFQKTCGSTRVCCACPCIQPFKPVWGPWLSPLPSKTSGTAELFGHYGVLGLAPCHAKEMLGAHYYATVSFCHHAFGTSAL